MTEPPRVSGFPSPPRTVTDDAGRTLELRVLDAEDREALAGMYREYDPRDRAQGIPPAGEQRLAEWLDTLLAEDARNVLAWHDDAIVGHATLVPDHRGDFELAIFVRHDHQGAGVGTALIRTLLGHGVDEGIERVWLTVEPWNRAARALYEKVGFETVDASSLEVEMALRLDGDDS